MPPRVFHRDSLLRELPSGFWCVLKGSCLDLRELAIWGLEIKEHKWLELRAWWDKTLLTTEHDVVLNVEQGWGNVWALGKGGSSFEESETYVVWGGFLLL